MRVEVSGTRSGQPWPAPGQTLDVDDDEGRQLCAAGIAVPEHTAVMETTAAPPAEVSSPPPAQTTGPHPAEKRGPGRPRKST